MTKVDKGPISMYVGQTSTVTVAMFLLNVFYVFLLDKFLWFSCSYYVKKYY
jgi:hypothetical protein